MRSASCSFAIKVQDTTPPTIVCPSVGPTSCPSSTVVFSAQTSDKCFPQWRGVDVHSVVVFGK